MLDGLGIATGPERIEIMIELERKRVEARETVANVRRDVAGVGQQAKSSAAGCKRELARLAGIVRHCERLYRQRTEIERASTAEYAEVSKTCHRRSRCSTRRRPDRHVVTPRERGESANVIRMLMRNQHGRQIPRLPTDRPHALLERTDTESAVNHDERRIVLDEQRVAATTAGERCETHDRGSAH